MLLSADTLSVDETRVLEQWFRAEAAGSVLSHRAHIYTATRLSPLGSMSTHVFWSCSHISEEWTEVFHLAQMFEPR